MSAHLQELWEAESHQAQGLSANVPAQPLHDGLTLAAVGCHWQADCFAVSLLPCALSLVMHQLPAAAPSPPGLQHTKAHQLLLSTMTQPGSAASQVTHGAL